MQNSTQNLPSENNSQNDATKDDVNSQSESELVDQEKIEVEINEKEKTSPETQQTAPQVKSSLSN